MFFCFCVINFVQLSGKKFDFRRNKYYFVTNDIFQAEKPGVSVEVGEKERQKRTIRIKAIGNVTIEMDNPSVCVSMRMSENRREWESALKIDGESCLLRVILGEDINESNTDMLKFNLTKNYQNTEWTVVENYPSGETAFQLSTGVCFSCVFLVFSDGL